MDNHNETIIKISLAIFLITFSLAYFFDSIHELPISKIGEITEREIGKHVKVQGNLLRQTYINENLFMEIKDETGKISLVTFKIDYELDVGKDYFFEGKVDSYRQNLQIITTKIRPVD